MSGKIEISRELIEAVAKEMDRLGYGHHEHHAESILHAIQVAAPVVERKPVAWIKPDVAATLRGDECCYAFGEQNPKGTLIPLYTSPPAPVADDLVRLLTRARIYARGEFRDEIDKCLDKVKELNQ